MQNNLIVFSEADSNPRTYIANQLHRLTMEARLNDIKICYIPTDFEDEDSLDAESALSWCPHYVEETPGFVVGYIPTVKRYQELYDAALTHNVRLINSPEESNRIMDFEEFYPLIKDLTPESWVVKDKEDLNQDFPYPLFVKGAIKSQKEKGWAACVANDQKELNAKCKNFFSWNYSARNKAILRRVLDLKYTEKTPAGFPMGREFRVLLYNHKMIDYGYYWMLEGEGKLSPDEEKIVQELAEEASRRIGTPLAVIDIGQDVNDKWWVIETGDPQFCAVTHIPGHVFWQHLKNCLV
jgi:hypothetical protein